MAVGAEAAGPDELRVREDCSEHSGIAPAAAALAWAGTVPVGTGLLPAPLRVALTATEPATRERAVPRPARRRRRAGVQSWTAQAGPGPGQPVRSDSAEETAASRVAKGPPVRPSARQVHR